MARTSPGGALADPSPRFGVPSGSPSESDSGGRGGFGIGGDGRCIGKLYKSERLKKTHTKKMTSVALGYKNPKIYLSQLRRIALQGWLFFHTEQETRRVLLIIVYFVIC